MIVGIIAMQNCKIICIHACMQCIAIATELHCSKDILQIHKSNPLHMTAIVSCMLFISIKQAFYKVQKYSYSMAFHRSATDLLPVASSRPCMQLYARSVVTCTQWEWIVVHIQRGLSITRQHSTSVYYTTHISYNISEYVTSYLSYLASLVWSLRKSYNQYTCILCITSRKIDGYQNGQEKLADTPIRHVYE